MSDWSRYKSAFKSAGGGSGGKFINLKDDESVTFFLPVQTPGMEESWWKGGVKVDHDTPAAEKSVKVVLSVYDMAAQCHRILRLTPPTFLRLIDKVSKDGGERPYTLSRSRRSGKVSYEVDKEDRLDAATLERIRREPILQVLDLEGVYPMEESQEPPAKAPVGNPSTRESSAVPSRSARPAKPSPFAMTSPDSEDPF